jgi:very-short-patch-repair endonuclease
MESPSTITLARSLRRSMTRSEQRLWMALRGKQLGGVKFRRQHVLGPYVVDFFCSARRLAIEIDGGVHLDDERQAHDAQRDAWMRAQGVRVLRIPDQLVRDNTDAALRLIAEAVAR